MPEHTAVQHVQQTWQAVFWLKLNDMIFTIQGKRTRRNWILFAAAKNEKLSAAANFGRRLTASRGGNHCGSFRS
jgi:hypothetical protein